MYGTLHCPWPWAETCFVSGGEAAVEVLGAGGAVSGLPAPPGLIPHPHRETAGFCALCPACLEPKDWGLPRTGFREDAPRDRVTVWALGLKLSLEEAVQVSCSRGRGRLWLPWRTGGVGSLPVGKPTHPLAYLSIPGGGVTSLSPEWVFRKSLPQDDPQAYCPPVLSALLWLLVDPGHKLALWVGGWVGGSVLQDLLPCLSAGSPSQVPLQPHPQGRPLSSWSLASLVICLAHSSGGQGVSVTI